MAEWAHLRRDASQHGGLITWHAEPPEGRDILLDLPGVMIDDERLPFDFTQCSEPVARIIDPVSEATVANLTWTGRADGTFSISASRVDINAAAGDRAVRPEGTTYRWFVKVTIPGGYHVQLVASDSTMTLRHKGD